MTEDIEILKDKHKDKPCVIAASGPSILKVNESYFSPDEIIITLNHSIVQIEKLNLNNTIYSMQKDTGIVLPKKAILLVSQHESRQFFQDYNPRYVFDTFKLCGENVCSAIVVLKIVQLFGCSPKIRMIGFDYHMNRDCRHIGLDGSVNYIGSEYKYHDEPMCKLAQHMKFDLEFVL